MDTHPAFSYSKNFFFFCHFPLPRLNWLRLALCAILGRSQVERSSLGYSEGPQWKAKVKEVKATKVKATKKKVTAKVIGALEEPNESKWVAWTRNYSNIEAFGEHRSIQWTWTDSVNIKLFVEHSTDNKAFGFQFFNVSKLQVDVRNVSNCFERRKGVEWKVKIHLSNPKDVICWWAVCVWW